MAFHKIWLQVSLMRLRTHGNINLGSIPLLEWGQIKIAWLLIQISNYSSIGIGHDNLAWTLPTRCWQIALLKSLAHSFIMLNSLDSLHVSRVESVLEVLGDPLLVKLLFYSIYNGHDSLNIFIKEFSLLETFESDHRLLFICFFLVLLLILIQILHGALFSYNVDWFVGQTRSVCRDSRQQALNMSVSWRWLHCSLLDSL